MELLGYVKRKVGLRDLILTGQTKGKMDRGKQSVTYIMVLSEWMVEQILVEITKMLNFQ